VGETGRVLQLEFGSVLIVSGYIGDPNNVVFDIEPRLSANAMVGYKDWEPLRDGRLSTNRTQPGEHTLYLEYTDPDGVAYFSELETVVIEAGGRRELALELEPAWTLRGRLASNVPRPVLEGEVMVNQLFVGDERSGAHRTQRAKIEADGTFVLSNLPPGKGEIIGLCDGWASRTEPGTRPHQIILQQFEAGDEDFVLEMDQTADFTLEILGPGGEPLPGAELSCWPNVRWSNSVAQIFLERTFTARADSSGVARLTGLPAGETPFSVTYEELVLPATDKGGYVSRSRSAQFEVGQELRRTVRLVSRDDELAPSLDELGDD